MHMLAWINVMKPHYVTNIRHVRLFKNGRSQAVRIPRDFELQGNEVLMHREGHRLIIEPISSLSLTELFAQWQPINDKFPDISDQEPEPVEL